jgi:hypothetical protein
VTITKQKITPDRVVVCPTKDQMIEAIAAVGHVDKDTAASFLEWMGDMVRTNRRSGHYYIMSIQELHSSKYRVLDAIIPHGGTSAPGSVHEMLERHLLDPAKGQLAIRHEQRIADGEVQHCTMTTVETFEV